MYCTVESWPVHSFIDTADHQEAWLGDCNPCPAESQEDSQDVEEDEETLEDEDGDEHDADGDDDDNDRAGGAKSSTFLLLRGRPHLNRNRKTREKIRKIFRTLSRPRGGCRRPWSPATAARCERPHSPTKTTAGGDGCMDFHRRQTSWRRRMIQRAGGCLPPKRTRRAASLLSAAVATNNRLGNTALAAPR